MVASLPSAIPLNSHFTGRSSNEWKLMTASLPPLLKACTAPFSAGSILSSSRFTSIRIAWKLLVAG